MLLPFYCAVLPGLQPTEQSLCCELPGSKELRRLSSKTKKLSWNGKPVGFAQSLIILRKDKSDRKILESDANTPHHLHHAAACADKRCPHSTSEACYACHTVREQLQKKKTITNRTFSLAKCSSPEEYHLWMSVHNNMRMKMFQTLVPDCIWWWTRSVKHKRYGTELP